METVKYVMIYRSPDPLKPFRIWAPVVFTLAENTAQSVSLGFDTRLLGNFNITVSVIVLLLKLVSLSSLCKNSLGGFALTFFCLTGFPCISLCISSLPALVCRRLLISRNAAPFGFIRGGGQFVGVPVRLGDGGVGSAGEVSLALLWMESCFCRVCLGTSRVGWLCDSHQGAEIAVER